MKRTMPMIMIMTTNMLMTSEGWVYEGVGRIREERTERRTIDSTEAKTQVSSNLFQMLVNDPKLGLVWFSMV